MQVRVRALTWRGEPKVEWTGEVVRRDDEEIVLHCRFTRDVQTEYLHFRTDDVTLEYYPWREWFNAFQVMGADGNLKGFYCNIATPPSLEDGALSYTDLTLDLFVFPDGRWLVLDEAEFEIKSIEDYPADVSEGALRALHKLIGLVEARAWIFASITNPDITESGQPL